MEIMPNPIDTQPVNVFWSLIVPAYIHLNQIQTGPDTLYIHHRSRHQTLTKIPNSLNVQQKKPVVKQDKGNKIIRVKPTNFWTGGLGGAVYAVLLPVCHYLTRLSVVWSVT